MWTTDQVLPYLWHENEYVQDLAVYYLEKLPDFTGVTLKEILVHYEKSHQQGKYDGVKLLIENISLTPACVEELLVQAGAFKMEETREEESDPLKVRMFFRLQNLSAAEIRMAESAIRSHLGKINSSLEEKYQLALEMIKTPVEQVYQQMMIRLQEADLHYESDGKEGREVTMQLMDVYLDRLAEEPEFCTSVIPAMLKEAGTFVEIYAVRLIGKVRLEQFAEKMLELTVRGEDFLNEELIYAFSRIQTSEILQKIETFLLDAKRGFDPRFALSCALQNGHTSEGEELILRRLEVENDEAIRTMLFDGLATRISEKGFDRICRAALKHHYDSMITSLDKHAYAMAIMFKKPQEIIKRLQDLVEKNEKDQNKRFNFGILKEMRELLGEVPDEKKNVEPFVKLKSDIAPQKPLQFEKRIGRNDPCPCGSGKKYKKCCMP